MDVYTQKPHSKISGDCTKLSTQYRALERPRVSADYSTLNPNLDKRVIPLFPYDGHLWAYMRCVLFHPDYAPFIPFGEQFPLAERIVNDHKGYVLTVGDIIYYVACFVEKREPSPPGVTRSTLTHAPRKIPQQSGINALFDAAFNDDNAAHTGFSILTTALKQNANPEVNTQKLTSTFYDLLDECAPPKETAAVKHAAKTIQDLWERSESGTIGNGQINRGASAPAAPRTSLLPHENQASPAQSTLRNENALLELDALFCEAPEPTQKPDKKPPSLSGLFSPQAARIESDMEASPQETPASLPPEKPLMKQLGGLFKKLTEKK